MTLSGHDLGPMRDARTVLEAICYVLLAFAQKLCLCFHRCALAE